jgi:hypothetical protein|nr:MAG TPA: hypothetical protein [Caudoviricetes sp.]
MGIIEKVWTIICLPFLWAWYKHPTATCRVIYVVAVVAALWGDSGRGI